MKKTAVLILASVAAATLYAQEIKITVEPGNYWLKEREPQAAVWLEDEDGNYLRTLYVTKKAEKKSWFFSPKEGRPESLPVWYHAASYDAAKSAKPETHQEALDAVTSATKKTVLSFSTQIEEDKAYVIRAEFNTSYDYNDFYTKKNSGVNGQPSVIYSEKIPAGFSGSTTLKLCGTGSLSGNDGKIYPFAKEITTAGTIVKNITVQK
ncbi:MAG: DUF2271 domain-containing protein [Treponema sp.]|nr:DUF2271 domain-containing protein [Treponema sp.]